MSDESVRTDDSWAAAPKEWFALRDIFRGPGLAIDGGKWLTGLLPTMLGLTGYLILAKLIPDWVTWIRDDAPNVHLLLRLLGSVVFCYAFAFAVSGVAYRVRGEVLDNRVRTWSDVIDFWIRRRWTLILPPLVLVFFAFSGMVFSMIFSGIAFLVSLASPAAGQLVWVLLFLFGIPFAIYAAAFLLVLLVGSFVYPAIVALKEEEVFDVVHDMFDIVRNRGPLLLLCIGVTALFVATTGLVVWSATNMSLWVGDLGLRLGGGEGVSGLKAAAPFFHESYIGGWLTCLWTDDSLSPHGTVIANLFGVMLAIITLLFVAYAVALTSCCSALTYLAMADPFEIEDLLERGRLEEQGGGVRGPTAAAAAAMAQAAAAATAMEQKAPAPTPAPVQAEVKPAPQLERAAKSPSVRKSQKKAVKKSAPKATTRKKAKKKAAAKKSVRAAAKKKSKKKASKKAGKKKSSKKKTRRK